MLMHHSRFGRTVSGIEFKSSGRAIDAMMSTPEPHTSFPSTQVRGRTGDVITRPGEERRPPLPSAPSPPTSCQGDAVLAGAVCGSGRSEGQTLKMKGSPDPHDGHIKVLIPPCVCTAADQRRGRPSVAASRQPLEEIIYHVQRGINGISQGCIAGLNIYISSLLTRGSKKQPGLMEPRPFRAPRFTFPKSDKGAELRD